jgi:hypothetical protein
MKSRFAEQCLAAGRPRSDAIVGDANRQISPAGGQCLAGAAHDAVTQFQVGGRGDMA